MASYSRFSMRRSWVVAGIPGTQTREPPPEVPPAPLPVPLLFPVPEGPMSGAPPTDPVQPAELATSNPTRLKPTRFLRMERVICLLPFCRRNSDQSTVVGAERHRQQSWKVRG